MRNGILIAIGFSIIAAVAMRLFFNGPGDPATAECSCSKGAKKYEHFLSDFTFCQPEHWIYHHSDPRDVLMTSPEVLTEDSLLESLETLGIFCHEDMLTGNPYFQKNFIDSDMVTLEKFYDSLVFTKNLDTTWNSYPMHYYRFTDKRPVFRDTIYWTTNYHERAVIFTEDRGKYYILDYYTSLRARPSWKMIFESFRVKPR